MGLRGSFARCCLPALPAFVAAAPLPPPGGGGGGGGGAPAFRGGAEGAPKLKAGISCEANAAARGNPPAAFGAMAVFAGAGSAVVAALDDRWVGDLTWPVALGCRAAALGETTGGPTAKLWQTGGCDGKLAADGTGAGKLTALGSGPLAA